VAHTQTRCGPAAKHFHAAAHEILDLETIPFQALTVAILITIALFLALRHVMPFVMTCCKRIGRTVVKAQVCDTFKISISIGNSKQYFCLNLMHLPFAASEFRFEATRFLSGLRVEGRVRRILKFKWPDLTISYKFAPLAYTLVKETPLTCMQAYHLRTILGKPYFVLFHVKSAMGTSCILPLEDIQIGRR
jgi:hypothetical protein